MASLLVNSPDIGQKLDAIVDDRQGALEFNLSSVINNNPFNFSSGQDSCVVILT